MRPDPHFWQTETYFAKPGRHTQEELAEQMRRSLDDPCIKLVLDAVTGFLMILNEDRQILAANQQLLESLDRHDEGCLVGLRFGEAMNCIHFTEGTDGCGTSKHCRTCGAVLAVLAAQAKERPVENECRLSLYRDGKLSAMDFEVRATPLEINGCRLTAFVLHDVSALKQRDVLEEVFLHDFLNSLGGIASWGELLREADQHTAARELTALAESLREEITTQRTLLAAERGELVAKREAVDVTELFAKLEVIAGRNPTATGKSLAVLPLPDRTKVVTDQVLLMRVLVNMVKNAFEATEQGGTVRLWFEWNGDDPRFVVHNPTVIPEHVQPRVFERSFSTRTGEARGIGTYSMKLYGERYLGGHVSFMSDQEHGTRFFMALPKQEPVVVAPDRRHPAINHAPIGKRVLLVDDNESLLRLGTLLLTRLGYVTTAVQSGVEALQAFRSDPQSYDAVITDWNMPEMSGAELVQRLEEIRRDVAILVCTGMGEPPTTQSAARCIRGSLAKPFTFQELEGALSKVISAPTPTKPTG